MAQSTPTGAFCANCGNALDQSDNFCRKCGAVQSVPKPAVRTISGTVTDSLSGSAIANVNVQICDAAGDYVEGTQAQTDASGAYSCVGLNPELHKVRTGNEQGYIDQWYQGVPRQADPSGKGATEVDATGADATKIDFALERIPAPVLQPVSPASQDGSRGVESVLPQHTAPAAFCPDCGHALSQSSSKFCGDCGATLSPAVPQPQAVVPTSHPVSRAPRMGSPRRPSALAIVVAVTLAVACLAVAGLQWGGVIDLRGVLSSASQQPASGGGEGNYEYWKGTEPTSIYQHSWEGERAHQLTGIPWMTIERWPNSQVISKFQFGLSECTQTELVDDGMPLEIPFVHSDIAFADGFKELGLVDPIEVLIGAGVPYSTDGRPLLPYNLGSTAGDEQAFSFNGFQFTFTQEANGGIVLVGDLPLPTPGPGMGGRPLESDPGAFKLYRLK